MDLGNQGRILELTRESKDDSELIVLLGSPDPESAELAALTVTTGDPTFAGPLAGVQLGLPVYHVVEDEVARAAEPTSYEENVGLMAVALDAEAIGETIRRVRRGG